MFIQRRNKRKILTFRKKIRFCIKNVLYISGVVDSIRIKRRDDVLIRIKPETCFDDHAKMVMNLIACKYLRYSFANIGQVHHLDLQIDLPLICASSLLVQHLLYIVVVDCLNQEFRLIDHENKNEQYF